MKTLLALLLTLLLACPAWAAVVNTAAVASADIVSDKSEAFSVPVGSNIIIVGCAIDDGTQQLTSVTYNSLALTLLQRNGITGLGVEIWYRVNPSTGSNTLVVDHSSTDGVACIYLAYSGVNTSAPFTGTADGDFTAASSFSSNVTCPAGNMALDVFATQEDETITKDASQTLLAEVENFTVGSLGMSEEAGAGTTAMSWTSGTNATAAQIVTCLMASTARPISPIIFQ